jgi:hypothetical protein
MTDAEHGRILTFNLEKVEQAYLEGTRSEGG